MCKLKYEAAWESWINWSPTTFKFYNQIFLFEIFQMRINMNDGDGDSRGERFVTHVDLSEPFPVSSF